MNFVLAWRNPPLIISIIWIVMDHIMHLTWSSFGIKAICEIVKMRWINENTEVQHPNWVYGKDREFSSEKWGFQQFILGSTSRITSRQPRRRLRRSTRLQRGPSATGPTSSTMHSIRILSLQRAWKSMRKRASASAQHTTCAAIRSSTIFSLSDDA